MRGILRRGPGFEAAGNTVVEREKRSLRRANGRRSCTLRAAESRFGSGVRMVPPSPAPSRPLGPPSSLVGRA